MMTSDAIETTRFGSVAFDGRDVVTLDEGFLGFPEAKRFIVLQHKVGSPFCWLQSVDAGDLAFLVIDPSHYVKDYAPSMSDDIAKQLALDEETPRLVYTIVTIPKGQPNDMTLNLAGPILINLENRMAKQVVVEDNRYPIRYKVFSEENQGHSAA
jgi:flagellar assembly factor FliW